MSAAPQFWSNPNTWPGGVVPGVGSGIGANATIPCNTVVILDVANLTLGILRIQGLLKWVLQAYLAPLLLWLV